VKALTAFPSPCADGQEPWLDDEHSETLTTTSLRMLWMCRKICGNERSRMANSSQRLTRTSRLRTGAWSSANLSVVYVPKYNPGWLRSAVTGLSRFYYTPSPGTVFGAGLAIGSGIGIEIDLSGGNGSLFMRSGVALKTLKRYRIEGNRTIAPAKQARRRLFRTTGGAALFCIVKRGRTRNGYWANAHPHKISDTCMATATRARKKRLCHNDQRPLPRQLL
jgi:hypothetical protein